MHRLQDQHKKLLKKAASFTLVLTLLFSMFSISLPAQAMGTTPDAELLKIDPYFPTPPSDVPYTLSVPTLENRLTVSADGKTATLFAPYVTAQSGWYDTNKNFRNDVALCWAASTSNLIAWYLDVCDRTGANQTVGYERNVHRIFDQFRAAWDPTEGYSMMQGCAWYFTGETLNGAPPANLLNPNSGGYLKNIEHNGSTWGILDPVNHYPIVGNYAEKFPFIEDETGVYYKDSPLYNHENFSKTIIGQLHYGATSLSVIKQNGGASGGHAITLWGCSYDIATGRVSKLYVTDSDDEGYRPGAWLKEITVKAASPDAEGIWLEGYTLPGDANPFRKVIGSTLLYAPGVVKIAGDKDAYIDAVPVISSVEKRGGEAVVTASFSKPNETLEYGYSKENRSSSVTNWQTDPHFTMPTENEVYFFVRVKENAAHKAGGVSNPYLFSLFEKPTKLPECPEIYKPYIDKIASQHPNWQFEFYDMGMPWEEALHREFSTGAHSIEAKLPVSYRKNGAQTPVGANGRYPANAATISYYLDPRNAMFDERIFAFEALKSDNGTSETSFYLNHFSLNGEKPADDRLVQIYADAESRYRAYKSISGQLEKTHIFKIPVYRDMPWVCVLPDYETGDIYGERQGDVDANGIVNLEDYSLLVDYAVGRRAEVQNSRELLRYDANKDGNLDMFDVAICDFILRGETF